MSDVIIGKEKLITIVVNVYRAGAKDLSRIITKDYPEMGIYIDEVIERKFSEEKLEGMTKGILEKL